MINQKDVLVVCPLCTKVETFLVDDNGSSASAYTMWRCAACKSEFAMPRQAVSSDYYDHATPSFRWEFGEVAKILNDHGITEDVLDIGCSDGAFISFLQKRGIASEGIDFNQQKVNLARKRGLNCTCIDLRQMASDRTFKAICAFHVLEHLEDPIDLLESILERIRDQGYAFVSVPNPRRFQVRFLRDEADYPPNHLSRIEVSGIMALAKRSGFVVDSMRFQPNDTGWLRALSLTANRILQVIGIREVIKRNASMNVLVKLLLYVVSVPWVMSVQAFTREKYGYTTLYVLKKQA